MCSVWVRTAEQTLRLRQSFTARQVDLFFLTLTPRDLISLPETTCTSLFISWLCGFYNSDFVGFWVFFFGGVVGWSFLLLLIE